MDTIDFHKRIVKNIDIPTDYKQLCRFCLDKASKKIDTKCIELFKLLTNVELVSKQEYPKSICSVCESQLQSACKFRVSLLEMERCWTSFFRNEYLDFINSINISEEHIYDEIFLEIEMDTEAEYEESLFDRSSVPLIEKNSQQQTETVSTKFFNRQTLGVHYGQLDSQKLKNQFSSAHLIKRRHDIISLSYESVNRSFKEENKLCKRTTKVSKVNKVKIKCVVVGDGAVGKTNLILSYLENKFVDQHIPTASDIYNFEVKVNKRPVEVTLCDTAGQDSLDQLRQLSYPNCNVFLLCFSVVNPESFTAIKQKWAPTLQNTEALFVIVGTQSDLRSDPQIIFSLKKQGLRPVPVSDAWDMAKSIGADFIETSSRNNLGVKNAFDIAIEKALYATKMDDSTKYSFWRKLICLS